MKKLLKVILSLFGLVLILLIGLFFVPDEILSPEAVVWLEPPVDPDPEKNIYHALLGFGVAQDKNFVEEGIRISLELDKLIYEHQKTGFLDEDFEAIIESINSITKPDLKIKIDLGVFSKPSETQSIVFWQDKQGVIASLFKENKIFIDRYQKVKKMTHYVNSVRPDLMAPLYAYESLSKISRLVIAHAAAKYLSSHEQQYLQLIYDEMVFGRLLLVDADSLIDKMIAAAIIKNSVYTLAQLVDVIENIPNVKKIPRLSLEELSLLEVMRYEFRLQESMARQMSISQSDISSVIGLEIKIPKVLLPVFFKKNHSLNILFKRAQQTGYKSELTGHEYWVALQNNNVGVQLNFIDYIKSPVGSLLSMSAADVFEKYIQRQHDLDGLITLFNLKSTMLKEGVTLEAVDTFLATHEDKYQSPYKDQPLKYDADKQELSFVSPDPNSRTNALHLELR